MSNSSKYQNYNEEDFARDPFFMSWVLAPDEVTNHFWINWLLTNPDKKPVLEKARWQMLQLTLEEKEIAQDRLENIWQNIQLKKAVIEEEENVSNTLEVVPAARGKIITFFSFNTWQQIAATILMVCFGAGLFFYLFKPAQQPLLVVSTDFGKIKKVVLPDYSEVVLNGNSKLSYAPNWSKEENRVVALEGEAYFSVTHTKTHQKFQVKLKNDVLVNVLGTKFTITHRPNKTQVVLNEGKVKVTKEQERYRGWQTAILAEELMQPGDLVEVQVNKPLFQKSTVLQPQIYAAFVQDKIIFKNALLSEVARVLEDTYGYRVSFAKLSLANKRFSGTTPTNEINMLFLAIEKLFGVKVITQGKHIIIQ